MRIYTRTGDEGQTGLLGGARVSKACPRLEACGSVDELNSALGILRLHVPSEVEARLERIQCDLFHLAAQVAAPSEQRLAGRFTQEPWPIAEMEADIDRMIAITPPLNAFVLPGGTPGSAHAHWARTVCRRAERTIVALGHEQSLEPAVLIYINRLSDWLFALARAENARLAQADIVWKP